MAGKVKVTLDPGGMAALAKSAQMQFMCRQAAERIAAHARGQGVRVGDHDGGSREVGLPVKVTEKVTDRAHATVAITHPSGVAVQAKHGVLTKAAASIGVQVRAGGSSRRLVRYTSRSGASSTITLAQALNYGGSYTEL